MLADLNDPMQLSTQQDFTVPTRLLGVTHVCGPKETIYGTFFKYTE
jgi:hypothetical protein